MQHPPKQSPQERRPDSQRPLSGAEQQRQALEAVRVLLQRKEKPVEANVAALNAVSGFLDGAYKKGSAGAEYMNAGLPLGWYYAGMAYDTLGLPEDAWRCFKAAEANRNLDPNEKNKELYSSHASIYAQTHFSQEPPFKDMLTDPNGLPGIRGRPALTVEDVAPSLPGLKLALGDTDAASQPGKPDVGELQRQFREETLAKIKPESRERLMRLPPTRVASELNERGLALLKKGEYAAAMVFFNGAVANNPDDDNLWVNRATNLYLLKKNDEAADSVEKALKINPNNPMAHNLRGVLYDYAGNPTKAYEYYCRATELQPDNTTIQANLQNARKRLQTTMRRQATEEETQRIHNIFKQVLEMGDISRIRDYLSFIQEHLPFISDRGIFGIRTNEATIQSFIDSIRPPPRPPRGMDESSEPIFGDVAGLLISALVNNSTDDKITLHVRDGLKLNYLGWRLFEKNLTINGNVGADAGAEMRSGKLTINGNVGTKAGAQMRSGELTINGYSGDMLGEAMCGGTIIVNGNVGSYAGLDMIGGKIIINGNAGDNTGLNMSSGGKIIVAGNAGFNTGKNRYWRGAKIKVRGKVKSWGDKYDDYSDYGDYSHYSDSSYYDS